MDHSSHRHMSNPILRRKLRGTDVTVPVDPRGVAIITTHFSVQSRTTAESRLRGVKTLRILYSPTWVLPSSGVVTMSPTGHTAVQWQSASCALHLIHPLQKDSSFHARCGGRVVQPNGLDRRTVLCVKQGRN